MAYILSNITFLDNPFSFYVSKEYYSFDCRYGFSSNRLLLVLLYLEQ